MVESKEWKWEIVAGQQSEIWKTPSIESFYLLNRWKNENKKTFLDLGCGIGRHSILFAMNGFDTYSFDLSENAIMRTKEWANQLNLELDYKVGDMLNLPYEDNSMDCILCRNVISHTDTEGMVKVIGEIKRVLKDSGECYLTLGSKATWGFKQEHWPLKDENTRIRMEDGPEYAIPHFYADYNLIQKLFADFKIEIINHIEDFYKKGDEVYSSYHYHLLIIK